MVELSKDSVRGREMTCSIAAMRKRTLDIGEKIRVGGGNNNKDMLVINQGEGDDELGWMNGKGRS